MVGASDEYQKIYQKNGVISILKAMQHDLLVLEKKSLTDYSIKESYQIYIAPMLLSLVAIFALGYLNEKINFEHCTPGVKNLFEIRVKHHYGVPGHLTHMISLLNAYLQGLQHNSNANSIPGIDLFDRENRFKLLASEFNTIYHMKQFRVYSQKAINYSLILAGLALLGALIFLPFPTILTALFFIMGGCLGVAIVSTASNLVVGYLEPKKRIAATQIKPFIEEAEAHTPERKIQAKYLNTIWNYIREAAPTENEQSQNNEVKLS
jgi:small-conductance mechanosensitive channel